LSNIGNSRAFPLYFENCPPPPPKRDPAPDDATLPTFESGALGLPEKPIDGTSIAAFDDEFAKKVGRAIEAMRRAIRECNARNYEVAVLVLYQAQEERVREGSPGPDRDPVSRARADADARNIARWLEENWPRYPTPCDKRTGFLDTPGDNKRFATFVTGGGSFALGGRSGAVTGVDSFLGPGERLIDNRLDGGASQGTGLLGVRVRAYATLFEGPEGPPVERGERPPPALSGIRGFFETGVQSSFGAASFTQNFSGVNAVPLGFGQQRINENFQIPIVIGVSLPVASGTRFDVYGGVALDSWTHTMSGGEAGAAGSSFFAAQNRFTVDPTVGVGLQIGLGRALGVPNLIAGVNAELQFRPGSVVTAPSSAFAAQTYYGTVNPAVNLQATARIGFAF